MRWIGWPFGLLMYVISVKSLNLINMMFGRIVPMKCGQNNHLVLNFKIKYL